MTVLQFSEAILDHVARRVDCHFNGNVGPLSVAY